MKNAIVTVFDDEYFKYARALLNSIKLNYPHHPAILACYDGNKPEVLNFLQSTGGVVVIPCQGVCMSSIGLQMRNLNLGLVGNPKVYFKYLLWTDTFDEYDNVLYLDSDTLVLQPLDYLFEQDDFFCVADNTADYTCRLFYPDRSADSQLLAWLELDGICFPGGKNDMLNAGMFLIPKKYRNPYYLGSLLGLTHRYNEFLMFADQSAISLWCKRHGIPIRPLYQYNFQACFFFDPMLLNFPFSEITILHYTWWKPDEEPYQSILRAAACFLDFDQSRAVYEQSRRTPALLVV